MTRLCEGRVAIVTGAPEKGRIREMPPRVRGNSGMDGLELD
ncbi:MAG: hypothetical protein WAO95_08505 [Burkholderiales bacterium]